jgi:hypothetical protein
MVMTVVAVATVMGMAILASNTLQAEASSNQDQAWQADAMAESGINLGLYYLQNLGDSDASKCPAAISALGVPPPSNTPYTATNLNVGASTSGRFDLTIDRVSRYRYTLAATGRSAVSGGVTRNMGATVDVNYYGYAMIATNPTTGSLTVPAATTVVGDIYSSIPVVNNGTITGTVYASSVSGSGSGGLLGSVLNLVAGLLSPSTANVNHYTVYTYNGSAGTGELIVLGTLDNVTKGPSALNPAGVFYTLGNLTLGSNVRITGTVVTQGGQLRVNGPGNSITAMDGMPAVVSDQDIRYTNNSATLDVNGMVYTGGRILRSGAFTGDTLTVDGGVMFGGSSVTIDANITVKVRYNRARMSVKGFDTRGDPPPSSVSVVTFSNNNSQ